MWRSEDTGGLILFGVVLGAATGAAGEGVGAGLGRAFRPKGTKIQIGVHRTDGALEPGNTVKVCVNAGDVPVPAKVLSVNTADDTISLQIEGSKTLVKIGKVAKLSGEVFSRENQLQGLRPIEVGDVPANQSREAYLVRDATPVHGDVMVGTNGEGLFIPRGKGNAFGVKLDEVRIIDPELHARAAGNQRQGPQRATGPPGHP